MAELMLNPLNHPVLLFVISMPALWFGARVGAIFHNRLGKLDPNMLEDFKIVLGATLTLLGASLSASPFRWLSAGTISAKTLRNRKPMRSGPSIFGLTCCQPPVQRECVVC